MPLLPIHGRSISGALRSSEIGYCVEESSDFLKDIDYVKEGNSDFYDFLQYIVGSRLKSVNQELIQKQLDKLKFSQEQQVIIWKWIKKEINFRETGVNQKPQIFRFADRSRAYTINRPRQKR